MKTNLLVLLVLLLAACASAPETKPVAAGAQPPTPETADKGALGAAATPPGVSAGQLPAEQKASVYFDFDSFNIKPEYREIVQRQADSLKASGGMVTLEGNSDERGSAEYNLALGDKRGYAVRKALEVLGVKSDQITVVSFGEEKPRSTCHEEKCWGENRRVDFNAKARK